LNRPGAVISSPLWGGQWEARGLWRGTGHKKNFVGPMLKYAVLDKKTNIKALITKFSSQMFSYSPKKYFGAVGEGAYL